MIHKLDWAEIEWLSWGQKKQKKKSWQNFKEQNLWWNGFEKSLWMLEIMQRKFSKHEKNFFLVLRFNEKTLKTSLKDKAFVSQRKSFLKVDLEPYNFQAVFFLWNHWFSPNSSSFLKENPDLSSIKIRIENLVFVQLWAFLFHSSEPNFRSNIELWELWHFPKVSSTSV